MRKYLHFIHFYAIIGCFFFFGLVVTSLSAQSKEYHISLSGNDAWSGTLSEPNAEKTDGPFRTFERARMAIRQLNPADRTDPVVYVHQGNYFFNKTFELTEIDSGITFRNIPGDSVYIQGGFYINNFEIVSDTVALNMLDSLAQIHVRVADLSERNLALETLLTTLGPKAELIFKKEPMEISGYPDEGYTKIYAVDADTIIRCYPHIIKEVATWGPTPDLWVQGYFYWDWFSSYQGVDSIDLKRRAFHLRPPQHHYGYRAGQRFRFLNTLQILDRPGEWYFDPREEKLYFWPPATMRQNDTYFSVLDSVMFFLNNTSSIKIQGLVLEGSYGTAVKIEGGKDNTIAGCSIRNIIDDAIIINGGSRNGVTGCDLYNLGASGIMIEGGNRLTLERADHFAQNNHIYNFANYQKTYHPAVSIRGVGHRVSHNVIHDAPHMALYWAGNEHRIEYNEIYDIAKETGDVGAMYSGRDWTWRGNVIRYNYIHDIHGPGNLGAIGVYLDDALSGTVVFGNVFFKSSMAILVGGGRDNRLENNIFIDCDPSIHVDDRGHGWASSHISPGGAWHMYEKLDYVNHDEPPYSEYYPELITLLDGDPALPEGNEIISNLHYTGQWLDFSPASWDSIVYFQDNIIVNEDPGFVDVEQRDWNLTPDFYSKYPHFQIIPFDSIGLYLSEYRDQLTWVEPQKSNDIQPSTKALLHNYPNPFNATTNIQLQIMEPGKYALKIYNLLGQNVCVLEDRKFNIGEYNLRFDTSGLASGFYFCFLQGADVSLVRKMLLVK